MSQYSLSTIQYMQKMPPHRLWLVKMEPAQ